MSLREQCPILNFADLGDERGKLVVIEGAQAVPFEIKRVFYIYDLSNGATTALAMMNLIADGAPQPLFTFTIGGDSPATYCSAPSANTGWGIVNGKLCVMASATRAGFAIFEFPERE